MEDLNRPKRQFFEPYCSCVAGDRKIHVLNFGKNHCADFYVAYTRTIMYCY